jgi:dTDP-4-amino-4,6-dideoxygalactose transaminase
MESLSCHGDLAVARMFASRLLTLPVHSGVRASDVCAMLNIIEDVLR